jgi:hypothetical protein
MGFCWERKLPSLEYDNDSLGLCQCVGRRRKVYFPFFFFSFFHPERLRTSNNAKDEIFAFKFVGFFDILTFLPPPFSQLLLAQKLFVPKSLFSLLLVGAPPETIKTFSSLFSLGFLQSLALPCHLLPAKNSQPGPASSLTRIDTY